MTGSLAAYRDAYRPEHHPDEASLVDYASGALGEAAAVLIASHLALCPSCRRFTAGLETLGGALIDDLPPSALAPHSLDSVMARLDDLAPLDLSSLEAGSSRSAPPAGTAMLPRPLRDYAGADLDGLAWKKLTSSIEQIELPLRGTSDRHTHLRLVRIQPGTALPRHTHRGTEMILVLSGGFRDRGQQFLRGDVAISDEAVEHRQLIDEDGGCICLSVTDAPLRFTGLFGWILNLFARF